jgi:hypothetical protein
MKGRPRYIPLVVIIAILGGLGLWLCPTDRDFHGKPESFWINQITNNDSIITSDGWSLIVTNGSGVANVSYQTLHFGSEGVPLLVKALSKGNRPWERFYFKLWPKLPSFLSGMLPKAADQSKLRIRSAMILHAMGSDALLAVPGLVRALHDDSYAVRQCALHTLEVLLPGMGQEKIRILPQLLEATRDGAPDVRGNAEILLGYYPDQASSVVPVVVNALNDSDALVRVGAMSSLTRLNEQGTNKAGVPTLVELLQDGNAEVREAATNALRAMAPEAVAKASIN